LTHNDIWLFRFGFIVADLAKVSREFFLKMLGRRHGPGNGWKTRMDRVGGILIDGIEQVLTVVQFAI
jgi:hypothetical protein